MKIPILTTLAVAAGLLTACNRSIESASQKFNELPPAVQKTVRTQSPQGEIANVATRTENGVQVYEIEFREQGANPKILVAADGRLLNSDGTRTPGVIEKVLTPT